MLVFTEAGGGVPVQGKKNPKQQTPNQNQTNTSLWEDSFQPDQFYKQV